MIIKLDDLKITKVNEDGSFSPYPITESEYFKSLVDNNSTKYNTYLDQLEKYHYKKPISETSEMTYEQFQDLRCDIQVTEGFKIQDPKIKIINNIILDGQHRLSILQNIYGEDYLLAVEIDENNEVIRFWGKVDFGNN